MRPWSTRKHGEPASLRRHPGLRSGALPTGAGAAGAKPPPRRVRGWAPLVGTRATPDRVPFALRRALRVQALLPREARAEGWRSVLWLDASCVVIRSLDPVFEAIEANGYVLFRNGDLRVGEWAGDEALTGFGLTHAQALALPEVSGGAYRVAPRPPDRRRVPRVVARGRATRSVRGISESLDSWDGYEDVKWNLSGRSRPTPASPRPPPRPDRCGHTRKPTRHVLLTTRRLRGLLGAGPGDRAAAQHGHPPRPGDVRAPHGPQDLTVRTDH